MIVLLATVVALKAVAPPPPTLNIVHHHLKRHSTASYQSLEATIVTAYDRAKVPLYWLMFQSTADPRDVVYLNLFETPADLARATETYRALAATHPELVRLSARLSTLLESQQSVVTTRRDEIGYARGDVDFLTMHALMLATFHVRAGHEGQFMDAVRKAGGGGAPWLVYESTTDPTFVLVWPLRTRREARAAKIPRPLNALRRTYKSIEIGLYALSASMSRKPR